MARPTLRGVLPGCVSLVDGDDSGVPGRHGPARGHQARSPFLAAAHSGHTPKRGLVGGISPQRYIWLLPAHGVAQAERAPTAHLRARELAVCPTIANVGACRWLRCKERKEDTRVGVGASLLGSQIGGSCASASRLSRLLSSRVRERARGTDCEAAPAARRIDLGLQGRDLRVLGV